jgi:vacuolar-type H+-ATPase subunit H
MKLNISKNLVLPSDVITQKNAFMGRTGSGKTYAFGKLAEEMLRLGMQVVILDPVGVHWGLRLAADGKSDGIKTIYVFGGLHGDIPIEPGGGKLIADFIADKHVSAIIDVSQFESDADKTRFATEWAARFFFRYKSKPSPVHLCLEECQEFIPQNSQKGEERMVHAFNRIWKLGRNFGIGGSLISQRPQEVNKKALNQTECFYAFQMTGPHERRAIEDWMKEKGVDTSIADDLPKLEVGTCRIWSPQWLKISKQIKIDQKWTYNASSTPEFGSKPINIKPLEPLEIEKLSEELKSTIEKAKAADPEILKKRIHELEKENKGHLQQKSTIIETDELKILRNENNLLRLKIEKTMNFGDNLLKLFKKSIDKIQETVPFLINKIGDITSDNLLPAETQWQEFKIDNHPSSKTYDYSLVAIGKDGKVLKPVFSRNPADIALKMGNDLKNHYKNEFEIGKGEKIVLTAIAQHEDGVDREQLTILTGYKRSSRDAYLQRLTQKGCCNISNGIITATEQGLAFLGENFEPLPTGRNLRDYWLNRLSGGEKIIFELLINEYPHAISRDDITERMKYKRSSRDAYIQRLAQRKLIEVGSGNVIASNKLF